MSKTLIALATLAMLVSPVLAEQAPKIDPPQKWIHVMGNLLSDEGRSKIIKVVQDAAKAGYTGVLINDVKLIKYQVQPKEYAQKLAEFRKACTDCNMKIIASVTPFGYASELLTHDVSLAEGMPVRGAAFVVRDGKLVPDESDFPHLVNGSFDAIEGGKLAGWTVEDAKGQMSIDPAGGNDGKPCLKFDSTSTGTDPRVTQKMKVKPWHYYHVSAMVKLQDFTDKELQIVARGKDRNLTWQMCAYKKNQDWAPIHATFDSLDNDEVTLAVGRWGTKGGIIWIDDVKIEPGGFVNVLRRPSLPLTVTSPDGKTTFEEGKDFSQVVDPKLLKDPREGYFTRWHEVPVVTIPPGSKLEDGQKVCASYHFPVTCGKPTQINICMSEPKVYEIVQGEIEWIRDNLKPDVYFMSHDEIRHLGWDDSCVKTGKTCGQILAENATKCVAIIEKVAPGKPIAVWSDDFDPNHNADQNKKSYYLLKGDGPLYESWLRLPKQVCVVNWSHKAVSVKFFSEHGNQQVISDSSPENIVQLLKECGKEPGVIGVMFTNWSSNYSKSVDYAKVVDAWAAEVGAFKK